MTVSVVIPTFNRVGTLGLTIESVIAQTLAPLEIIVIDDGSTDNTAQFIRARYPSVKLIEQPNSGVSHARNRGIEFAVGEWIALVDSDDRWFRHKLATQMQAMRDNPGYLLCHCDEHWIRNGKRVNPMNKHKKQGGWIFEHCLPMCAISPSAAMIHKSLFKKVGTFDESLPACEDYDLWLRICAAYPVLYVDEALLEKTGGHDDQLSRKYWGMDRFRLQALAKIIRSGKLPQDLHDAAMRCFTEKLNIVTNGSIKRGKHDEVKALQLHYQDLIN